MAPGIFAVAPYVGFLAPVAALSLGLPFIIGGAIFSVAVIALSAVVISKNSTISQKEKFENFVAARKKEEANERAELKAKGLLPDVIELPYKLSSVPDIIALPDTETETPSPKSQPTKEEKSQSMGALGKVTTGAGALKDVYYDNCTKSNTPIKLDEVKASSMDNGACLGLQM